MIEPGKATLARRRNARAHRAKVLADGGRRLDLLLSAEAATALDEIQQRTGETATDVVARLLLQESASSR